MTVIDFKEAATRVKTKRANHRAFIILFALSVLLLSLTRSALALDLQGKGAEIVASCGAKIISAYSNRNVLGTRIRSCHAFNQAIDMQGNPACIYSHLQNWPGGYSIDYARMGHVHISSCAREMGLRFNHGQRRKVKRFVGLGR